MSKWAKIVEENEQQSDEQEEQSAQRQEDRREQQKQKQKSKSKKKRLRQIKSQQNKKAKVSQQQDEEEQEAVQVPQIQIECVQDQQEAEPQKPKISLRAFCILLVLAFIVFLQVKGQTFIKTAHLIDYSLDYYQVLGVKTTDSTQSIKSVYKSLLQKFHPDKIEGHCDQACYSRFQRIKKAGSVLSSSQERQKYDNNVGKVPTIKSAAIELDQRTFQRLGMNGLPWMIQVYDQTQSQSVSFNQIWQQFIKKHDFYVNFGRISLWKNPNAYSFLPYKFPFLPSFFVVQGPANTMCSINYQRPLFSLEECLDQAIQSNPKESRPTDQDYVEIFGNYQKAPKYIKLLPGNIEYKFDSQNRVVIGGEQREQIKMSLKSKDQFLKMIRLLNIIVPTSINRQLFIQQCQYRSQYCLILLKQFRLQSLLPPFKVQSFRVPEEAQQPLRTFIQGLKNQTQKQEADVAIYFEGQMDILSQQQLELFLASKISLQLVTPQLSLKEFLPKEMSLMGYIVLRVRENLTGVLVFWILVELLKVLLGVNSRLISTGVFFFWIVLSIYQGYDYY